MFLWRNKTNIICIPPLIRDYEGEGLSSHFRVYDFPYSFQEPNIRSSSFYSSYLQRVVDLVQSDEIDAAGRVLIILTTVAASETSSKCPDKSKYHA